MCENVGRHLTMSGLRNRGLNFYGHIFHSAQLFLFHCTVCKSMCEKCACLPEERTLPPVLVLTMVAGQLLDLHTDAWPSSQAKRLLRQKGALKELGGKFKVVCVFVSKHFCLWSLGLLMFHLNPESPSSSWQGPDQVLTPKPLSSEF